MGVLVLFLILSTEAHSNLEPRIVGGAAATIQRFPHSVLLDVEAEEDSMTCGASVLSQRVILTAGHCVYGYSDENIIKTAFAGHEDMDKMRYMREIKIFIVHADFDETTFANDIALVLLTRPLILGPTVKRVIIDNKFRRVRDAIVAGWGIIDDEQEVYTNKLKYVKQTVQDVKACSKIYKEIHGPFLPSGVLCAQNDVNNRPSSGDSGSALMSSTTTQIGLVSFRLPPYIEIVVYTNVTYYHQWLRYKTKQLYCTEKIIT